MNMSWKTDLGKERRDIEKVKPWLMAKLRLDELLDASDADQREKDIDLYGLIGERRIPIEVKIRYKHYPDLLIETVSNIATRTRGWIHRSRAELLVYVFLKKKSITEGYIYNLKELRDWWMKVGVYDNYPRKYGKTDNLYETENRAVPLNRIPLDTLIYSPKYNLIDDYLRNIDALTVF